MAKMAKREDFRQRLTNALIASMEEADGLPWQRGWVSLATRPFNPGTGVKYKGGNVLSLMLEQLSRGSEDPRWMTLKQANAAGYSIRKGAKASYVEYWDWGLPGSFTSKPSAPELDDEGEDEEQARKRTKPRVFYAAVFNGADIVGLPEMRREQTWEPHAVAEKLLAATGAEIEHAAVSRAGFGIVENAAYYSPAKDKMVIPPRASFKSLGSYYATVFHELGHWTGHSSRLNRHTPDERLPFGSPGYAREELRAEIASLFLNSMLGIEGSVQNHARYTSSWLEALKADKHEIFRAARDAEQIVDHIFGYAPELREVVESTMVDNLLPEDAPKRALATGISNDLPDFVPPEAKLAVRVGREDPRWAAFERILRGEAAKVGLNDDALAPVFEMIEPSFTAAMDAAKKNGHSAEDMYEMLTRSIVDEMRQADACQGRWVAFCERVKAQAADLPMEQIDVALQELGARYQSVVVQGAQERWSAAKTESALNQVLFGSDQDGVVDPAYVVALVGNSVVAQVAALTGQEADDDLVLTPLGMDGDIPEDAGIVAEERIHAVP